MENEKFALAPVSNNFGLIKTHTYTFLLHAYVLYIFNLTYVSLEL